MVTTFLAKIRRTFPSLMDGHLRDDILCLWLWHQAKTACQCGTTSTRPEKELNHHIKTHPSTTLVSKVVSTAVSRHEDPLVVHTSQSIFKCKLLNFAQEEKLVV